MTLGSKSKYLLLYIFSLSDYTYISNICLLFFREFVNCVRCIKILSPQEVQQMSLDGDFGNSVLPNQACSSSDGGNV